MAAPVKFDPVVGEDATSSTRSVFVTGLASSTRGRTLYIKPTTGDLEYDTIALEGLVGSDETDEDAWVPAVSYYTDPETGLPLAVEVPTDKTSVHLLGLDFVALRLVCEGGSDAVEADPEHEPPIEAEDGSSIEWGLIG